jgi:uncharacterized protein YbjQ (UPF0145 family)
MIVATTNEIAAYRIVRHLGLVRGVTVRSRSVVGNIVGGIQSIFGGKLGAFVQLAETARQEAYDHMCEHATQGGANAVVCMRYDANGSWTASRRSWLMARRFGSSRSRSQARL